MRKFIFTILILIYSSASFASSDMLNRLIVIADSDGEEILLDKFINGTEDYYIATLVRPLSSVNKDDLSNGMLEILESIEDQSELYIRELNAYSKKNQSSMQLQRSLVKKPYYESSIYPEIVPNPQPAALRDEAVEMKIWEAIAGESGLGYNMLSDDHEPVELSGDKTIVDTGRYFFAAQRDGAGVYIDKKSIVKTQDGCTAWIIETVSARLEDAYGELISNLTGRPFQKANITMIKAEFNFSKSVCRTLRHVYYGVDNKIIYSSVSAESAEISADEDSALKIMFGHVKAFTEDM